jgi:hypothetical protein
VLQLVIADGVVIARLPGVCVMEKMLLKALIDVSETLEILILYFPVSKVKGTCHSYDPLNVE